MRIEEREIFDLIDEAIEARENAYTKYLEPLINDIIDFHIDLGEFESIEGHIFEKQRTGEKLGKQGGIKTSQPSLQKYLTILRHKTSKLI